MMSDSPIMVPFLSVLDDQQQRLVTTVGLIYSRHGRWPTWQYIEETLERENFNAAQILTSIQREPTNSYGYVWPTHSGTPGYSDQIGLTIAGLATIQAAEPTVAYFLRFVSSIGTIRSSIDLDPFEEIKPTTTRDEISALRRPFVPINQRLLELLHHEPATWHCELVDTSSENWRISLPPELRRFAGVSSVEDYLDRLRTLLIPVRTSNEVPYYSPFTLPAAIDYLDVVWQLNFGNPLVVPPGVERSARLAFDASTPEEVDSRLSALAELLKNLQVQGVKGKGGHPLERLGAFLETHLPQEVHERINKAVQLLDDVRRLRTGGQHFSANTETVGPLNRLGIGFPVSDWPMAWQQIQKSVATAFDAIRDELQASTVDEK